MTRRNESLPKPSKDQSVAPQADIDSSRSIEVTSTWSGPIPPPDALREFNEIVPGSAERIFDMAEKQLDHRLRMEETVVRGDSRRSYLGLIAGFMLSATLIAGGVFLVVNGHDWAGGLLVGVNILGLAGAFVYGTHSRRAEREHKAERMRGTQ